MFRANKNGKIKPISRVCISPSKKKEIGYKKSVNKRLVKKQNKEKFSAPKKVAWEVAG